MKKKKNLKDFIPNESLQVNKQNHLEIAGIDTVDLASKYGTPLMIYDLAQIKKNIQQFKEALKTYPVKTEISYASKAFSSLALYQVLAKEDIAIDVVSGGELYLAIQAGFPAERINFHGNNKSVQELEAAINYGIGHIIVDNFYELELLKQLTENLSKKVSILIRITPGVTTDTHRHIMTGHRDSKFGFDLASGQAQKAVEESLANSAINLEGIHLHIGSQIFDTESYFSAMEQTLVQVKKWSSDLNFEMKILNIGGGFGVQHTETKNTTSPKKQVEHISKKLQTLLKEYELSIPQLWIEPGRSIVSTAGITIYELGSQKIVEDVRHYISVDGGMTDNIRPAFYDAKYYGKLANRMNDQPTSTVSIAGKACESGDMLIHDLSLPKVNAGDLLAVFNTGDYSFSMASNYNRIARPAVVFVEDGKDFLAIRRETPKDFMRFENNLPKDF